MSKFIDIVKEALVERGKSVLDLFENNIVSENTFYKYKNRNPNLKTLISIANYLEVNIDYLFELANENQFKPYKEDQTNFYNRLSALIQSMGVSQRQFCREMNYSRSNLTRWKNGIYPSIQTLLELCNYFNCSTNELLDRE